MPKLSYQLVPGGKERINLSWNNPWKNMSVEINGEIIGTIQTQDELMQGMNFEFEGDSTLEIKLEKSAIGKELLVSFNGNKLKPSASDPERRLKQSYSSIFIVATFVIFLGLAGLILRDEFYLQVGGGALGVVSGLIYFLLGYFVRKRSLAALIITLILYGLDSLLILINGFNVYIFVRIIFLFLMWQGISAIKELKE